MTDSLSARALDHIRALARDIGPRPAGSEPERRAFDYIAEQLRACGYEPQTRPAPFAPLPRFNPLHTLAGLLIIVGCWSVATIPIIALGLPLMIAALPQIARLMVRRRSRTVLSQNLVAFAPAPKGKPTLIFCAHADSARAIAFQHRRWRWLYSRTLFIAMRVSILAAVAAVIALIGITLPGAITIIIGLAGAFAGGWMALADTLNQIAHRNRYSPGANDNASGVGVVLALAEHFAHHPPSGIRLGFLFTGAEETGLHGAESFAESAERGTMILNFDMVGAGSRLHFVTADGTLFPLRTDEKLSAAIRRAYPQATGIPYSVRSGDFAPFLRRGLAAASLQTGGSSEAELAYHTSFDTIELIDSSALEMAAQTTVRVVEILSTKKPPDSSPGGL